MTLQSISGYLVQNRMFQGLPARHIGLLAELAAEVTFDAGQYLYREREEANEFHVILEGRVSLELPCPNHRPLAVQTVEAGEVVGWSWLFAPYQRRFDVCAVVPTRAIVFDAKRLRSACESDHALGYALLKILSAVLVDRLRATQLQLLDLYNAS